MCPYKSYGEHRFNFKETAKLFQGGDPFCIPWAAHRSSCILPGTQCGPFPSACSHASQQRSYLPTDLTCFCLKKDQWRATSFHVLIFLLYFLWWRLCPSLLSIFLIRLFVSLLLTSRSSFYILDKSHMSDMYVVNISPSLCPACFCLTVSFENQIF